MKINFKGFAQFFISPLFDAGSTERELNAVNSENQKNLQSDAWRLDQLGKSTSNASHPYSKFGTGNLQTLKVEPESKGFSVREKLLKFHSKYYSANLMTLCLLGKGLGLCFCFFLKENIPSFVSVNMIFSLPYRFYP